MLYGFLISFFINHPNSFSQKKINQQQNFILGKWAKMKKPYNKIYIVPYLLMIISGTS